MVIGALLVLGLEVLPELHPPVLSVDCAFEVTNQSTRAMRIVPLSSSKRFAAAPMVILQPQEEKLVQLTQKECEGVGPYPDGPLLGFAVLDAATGSLVEVHGTLDSTNRPKIRVGKQ